MRTLANLVMVALFAVSGCGKKAKVPKGEPLFADDAWKERPAEALQDLAGVLGPDWQITADAVERKSDTELSLRGLQLANADGSTVLAFESVEVRGTSQAVDLAGKLKGVGSVEARARTEPTASEVKINFNAVRVGEGDGWRLAVGGVPLQGILNARISARLPEQSWAKADVSIELTCGYCGTAEGKVQPSAPARGGASSAFASSGLTLPAITLGDVKLMLKVEKGSGTFSLTTGEAPDMTVEMDGNMTLADPFSSSTAKLCMNMRLSDEARSSSPKLDGMMSILAKGGADAGISMSASGRLDALRFRPVAGCD